MIEIKGKLIRRPRVQIPAPEDGVHRNGSDGFLKGSHCMYLNNEIPLYHGQVGFWWRTGEDTGLKVFYSVKHGWSAKSKWVKATRRRQHMLHKMGVCPKPGNIVEVMVDLNYKDRVIKRKKVLAIESEHVHCPEKAWEMYANGHPYDFSSYDHPDHSPDGYIKAKKHIDKTLKKAKLSEIRYVGDSYKLGDVLFCTKKNKWFIVDVG